jgi:hypothetical protein
VLSIRFVLQDKAARVAALGYVVRHSDGNNTSETRHPFAPPGFFGEERAAAEWARLLGALYKTK